MSEDPTPDVTTDGPPPWLGALARACGDEVHRYCAGMLGDEAAAEMLRRIFADVLEEVGPEGAEPEALRLTTLAVAHNQCMAKGRRDQRPPIFAARDDAEVERALAALAQLRPIGRGVSVLRHGLGLPWSVLQRVCGEPRARLVLQVSRGWRRMVHFAEERDGRAPIRRPRGRPLPQSPEAWAAIREEARAFARLREALRRAIAEMPGAPEGWVDEVWPEVLRRREARIEEEQRAIEREAARQAEAEAAARAEVEAEQEAERQAARRAEAEAEAKREAERQAAARREAERRRASRRRWTRLAVLIAAGLAVGWLAMR